MALFTFAFRAWIGIILVAASVAKLGDRRAFAKSIETYRIVPTRVVDPIALTLPLFELAAGTALVVGIQLRGVAGLSAVLVALFACAIVWNLLQGRRFDCGCGTGEDQEISWRLVAKDLWLAAMCVFVAIYPARGLALWPGVTVARARPLELMPVVMVVLTVAVMLRVVDVVGVPWRDATRGGA